MAPTPTPSPTPAGNGWSHVTTSPFPSPCPSSSVPESTTTTKSTEQIWKEIKLASLCDGSSSSSSSTTSSSRPSPLPNMLLHDFLAGPFTKHSSALVLTAESAQPTKLNFTSSCAGHKQSHISFLSSFDALKTSTIRPSNSKKRVHQDACGLSDQRYQRMIKNRESAVRSRARKQAYRNSLEFKLARLTEENSRLRRQVEEFKLFLPSSAKHPKMRTLYRTSTSPF